MSDRPITGMSAFSYWLRTGRYVSLQWRDGIQVKFNPWHDPRNGQFTFANSGTFYDFRGGGGQFGGGGATGSWPRPARPKVARKAPILPRAQPSARKPSVAPLATPAPSDQPASGANATPPKPKPTRRRMGQPKADDGLRHVMRNGYQYDIDSLGRTRQVSGPVTVTSQNRSRAGQLRAGGADRRLTDDGGHYIAARLNGPPDDFNLFAQDRNFNRGAYRVLENIWAKAKFEGHSVAVKITPAFEGVDKRPVRICVTYWIDGAINRQDFSNAHQGK